MLQLRATAVMALGVGLFAGAAQADWLVLRDGSRVETAAPWRVDGKLVVFERPGGKLASLRLAEVDLAASEEATQEAARLAEQARTAPPPAPEPKKKAVLVLTDADIPRAGGSGDEEGQEGGETGGAAAGELAVVNWDRVETPDGQGIQISGSVQNRSAQMATDLGLKVALYDADGQLLASRDASIARATLPPGADANFNVDFPDVLDFAAAKFEPRFRSFESREVPSAVETDEGGAGDDFTGAEESPPASEYEPPSYSR